MPTKGLFEPDFLRRVAALRLEAARRGTRAGAGAAGAPRASLGFELADFRAYAAGDDPRSLDWNALARWDEAVVRRFRDAEPSELWLVVDRSPSMDFGMPTKDVMARRIAGALGAMAAASGVRPRIAGEPPGAADAQSWLRQVEELGGSDRPQWGRLDGARRGAREWVVLGDLYEAAPLGALVERARREGDPVTVAAIWSREDREPPEPGTEAVDAETGERRVYLGSGDAEFRSRRDEFVDAWRARAEKAGAGFVEIDAAQSWESAALAILGERARHA